MDTKHLFANLPTIETDRIIIRKMCLNDADDMFEYASDPEVSKYTGWYTHYSIEDTKLFLHHVINSYLNNQVSSWGIVHKLDEKFIGTLGFIAWNIEHARGEIGYALSRKYWGKGYMTEVVNAIIYFGFSRMMLNRIEARCAIQNIASARVMEKVGMKYEGILRQHMFMKGKYRDLKIYSITKDEFSYKNSQSLIQIST
ncbi:MAG: GNAT family protein [Microcoleaceae cyanobacterium MO_207.B10]|nr:GNAT family protein [Microcoleaceae cyanobacterium MO_207.B10]